ncbi:uncharacterized protein LOC113146452 [Cyclospora cayetanensis]|uniref:Uncharacterized protein LOC113146452 n=1 Tax=Cyclospora cayetanensis TaxID=88456 RepID=A0A6P6RP83_9EIME|nr:uncharacterized protein LOC113146452 [Cyclospora cayetanensis]
MALKGTLRAKQGKIFLLRVQEDCWCCARPSLGAKTQFGQESVSEGHIHEGPPCPLTSGSNNNPTGITDTRFLLEYLYPEECTAARPAVAIAGGGAAGGATPRTSFVSVKTSPAVSQVRRCNQVTLWRARGSCSSDAEGAVKAAAFEEASAASKEVAEEAAGASPADSQSGGFDAARSSSSSSSIGSFKRRYRSARAATAATVARRRQELLLKGGCNSWSEQMHADFFFQSFPLEDEHMRLLPADALSLVGCVLPLPFPSVNCLTVGGGHTSAVSGAMQSLQLPLQKRPLTTCLLQSTALRAAASEGAFSGSDAGSSGNEAFWMSQCSWRVEASPSLDSSSCCCALLEQLGEKGGLGFHTDGGLHRDMLSSLQLISLVLPAHLQQQVSRLLLQLAACSRALLQQAGAVEAELLLRQQQQQLVARQQRRSTGSSLSGSGRRLWGRKRGMGCGSSRSCSCTYCYVDSRAVGVEEVESSETEEVLACLASAVGGEVPAENAGESHAPVPALPSKNGAAAAQDQRESAELSATGTATALLAVSSEKTAKAQPLDEEEGDEWELEKAFEEAMESGEAENAAQQQRQASVSHAAGDLDQEFEFDDVDVDDPQGAAASGAAAAAAAAAAAVVGVAASHSQQQQQTQQLHGVRSLSAVAAEGIAAASSGGGGGSLSGVPRAAVSRSDEAVFAAAAAVFAAEDAFVQSVLWGEIPGSSSFSLAKGFAALAWRETDPPACKAERPHRARAARAAAAGAAAARAAAAATAADAHRRLPSSAHHTEQQHEQAAAAAAAAHAADEAAAHRKDLLAALEKAASTAAAM